MLNELIIMAFVALMQTIEWDKATRGLIMSLKDAAFGEAHTVAFLRVNQTDSGAVVATVDSETLEGDTLWLAGQHGPQNGLLSLLKAAGEEREVEGKSFTFTRVESENSPAGYAYRWEASNSDE